MNRAARSRIGGGNAFMLLLELAVICGDSLLLLFKVVFVFGVLVFDAIFDFVYVL
jgi:hypothetical protein